MIKVFSSILFFALFLNLQAQNDAKYCSESKIKLYNKTLTLYKTSYYSDTTINITYYKLNLFIDYNSKFLKGVTTIKLKPSLDAINNFYLDFYSDFNIDSVVTSNIRLSFSKTISNKLIIYLNKSYPKDTEIAIDIHYHGTPNSNGGIGGSFVFEKTQAQNPVIWTLSQPYGARDWFPCKDTPSDKADSSDVWITADSFFVSVSNGILNEVVNNHDGTKTYKWKNSYPIANYLISLAMSNYFIYETKYEYDKNKFLPIIHYIYPENFQSYKDILDLTPDMMKIFSNKFGEYPFIKEKYGHAEFGFSGGMEHQTCTSIGVISEDVIAHELAHQWFGDKVTCRDWHHIWLNEGFATYITNIYFEEKYGKEKFAERINSMMTSAKLSSGSIYVQNIDSDTAIFNYNRTYNKGATVLHMLRGILGDEIFYKTLKEYLNDPKLAYSTATTEDFQKIAERVSGMNLKYFFDEWIYGENYPKYIFKWNYYINENDKYTITINLSQKPNTNPQYFIMPIKIRVTTTAGITNLNLFNDKPEQQWDFEIDGLPINVEFDPDNWILKDVEIQNLTSFKKETPLEFLLFQNYPNPFNPNTFIKYQIPAQCKIVLKIYDILGKEITTLINDIQQPGNYVIEFNAEKFNLSSGVYYYKLSTDFFTETKKMMLIK
ncbi:M1 family aminopeptidase [Rosettibacter firmus]|uniref:M1 family aminopeptidase n=1 Tax=Rosettibacter firmus TaxID=3111522 RepID=UPI00336C10AB